MDKYDKVLIKAETNWTGMTKNEKFDFAILCKEHGTERGNKARALRDNKE